IAILFSGIVLLAFYARAIRGDRTNITDPTLKRVGIGSALGIFAGAVSSFAEVIEMPLLDSSLLGTCTGGILGASSTLLLDPKRISSPFPTSLWGWMAVIFTVSQSIGF